MKTAFLKEPFRGISRILSLITITTLSSFIWIQGAQGGVTRVGNGDEGQDLERLHVVEGGILVETRDEALLLLQKLNVRGIPQLGRLVSEIEKSKILLAHQDVNPKFSFDQGFEKSSDGKFVYARTFAEPGADTRFFPAALTLSREQLVALHIHEGLHRALAPEFRENEELVSKITLAITARDSSYDRVFLIAKQDLSVKEEAMSKVTAPYSLPAGPTATTRIQSESRKVSPQLSRPSIFSYEFKVFSQDDKSVDRIHNIHSIKSFLYPFGEGDRAFGFGVELSYLRLNNDDNLGPIEISARQRLFTVREFDVDAWARGSFSSTNEELEKTQFGRDVYSIGLSATRLAPYFYVNNSLGLTFPSQAKQNLGGLSYQHRYGSILNLEMRAGARLGDFRIGGLLDLSLGNNYEVKGEGFNFNSGRYRIFTLGPELAYENSNLRWGVSGGWLIDSTDGVDINFLGDLLARGAGRGYVASEIGFKF